MNNYSEKDTEKLIDLSIGLSKILDKTPLVLDKEDFNLIKDAYKVEDYLKRAKEFLYLPKISQMYEQIREGLSSFLK